jgi:hypothetical protein
LKAGRATQLLRGRPDIPKNIIDARHNRWHAGPYRRLKTLSPRSKIHDRVRDGGRNVERGMYVFRNSG